MLTTDLASNVLVVLEEGPTGHADLTTLLGTEHALQDMPQYSSDALGVFVAMFVQWLNDTYNMDKEPAEIVSNILATMDRVAAAIEASRLPLPAGAE